MRKIRLLMLLFPLLIAAMVWAQSDRGTITGTITDPSGAVIAGADVVATNLDTGVVTKSQSNESGLYSLLNLPPGNYSLSIKRPGFRPVLYPRISLIQDQVARMNVVLPIGTVNEVVEVHENAPMLETETPTLGTNMKGSVINDLPLSIYGGRSVETFAVYITPGYSTFSDPYQAVINGTQAFTKDITVDGTSATAQIQGDSMEIGPSMEAVQEVHAETIGIGAQNAITNGGVVLFNLKSGTNKFHGSAFNFGHNELLDANTWENGYLGLRKPKARFWEWGFSAGGPIFKNKTFVFGAFERFQMHDFTMGGMSATVPTANFLNGNFGALLDTSTVLGTDTHGNPIYKGAIFNPSDPGAVFVDNIIPPGMISAKSQQIVDLYKQHYVPETNALTNNNRMTSSNSPSQTPNQIVIKVDHNIKESDILSGSWIYNHRPRLLVDQGGVWSPGSSDGGVFANARYQMVKSNQFRASESHTFSPNMVNVFNATYNWYWNGSIPGTSTDWNNYLGFSNADAPNFPKIGFGPTVNGYYETGIGNTWQGYYVGATTLFGDHLSWVKGRHNFTLGGEFRAMQINSHGGSGALSVNFSNSPTGLIGQPWSNEVGFGFASFLLGAADSASETTPFNLHGRRKAMSMFAQDDYKATNKLTLNLGLRWDVNFRLHEKDGHWANFDLTKVDPVLGIPGSVEYATGGGDSFERNQHLKNFGPHIGFAYNPVSKLVFRGSYGMIYVPIGIQFWQGVPYGYAPGYKGTNQVNTPFNWDAGYPGVFQPPTKLPTAEAAAMYGVVSYDPNSLLAGYTHNFNFGVQYEISKDTRVEASFVSNRGRRLHDTGLFSNQPDPTTYFNLVKSGHDYDTVDSPASAAAAGVPYPYAGFSGWAMAAIAPYPQVARYTTSKAMWGYPSMYVVGLAKGRTSYDSLVLRINRRAGSNLAMDFNYTYSKMKGNTTSAFDEGYPGGSTSGIPQLAGIQDYSKLDWEADTLSPYDQKHVFKGYVTYQLPLGHGRRFLGDAGRTLNAVVNGWSVSTILRYGTGTPLSFYSWSNSLFAGSYFYDGWAATYMNYNLAGYSGSKFSPGNYIPQSVWNAQHPDPDPLWNTPPPGNSYFPSSVAVAPGWAELGTGPVRIDALRGFGQKDEDLSVMKRFGFGNEGRFQLAFRVEFYNLFNRHVFANPVTDPSSPWFGYVTALDTNFKPRQGQFGVRFEW